MKHVFAVIMAGGIGSRFWPHSRKEKPKQYLSLLDNGTLIQATTQRLRGFLPDDHIYVISTQEQQALLNDQLPWLPNSQIFFEPMGRNTAPAVGLSAIMLQAIDPNATMIILPADHTIANTKQFQQTLKLGVEQIEKDPNVLVTLGIEPDYPATGYGYIEAGEKVADTVYRVRQFREKPDLDLAKQFLQQSNFLWNSGIFFWQAATVLKKIEQHMPGLHQGLETIRQELDTLNLRETIRRVYEKLPKQSIDYGIMEKAENVLTIRADFGWNDLGSWKEVYRQSPKDENGNVVLGSPLLKNVENSYINIKNRIVSVIGVSDLVVVDTEDALLICHQNSTQDVRWVTNELEEARKKKHD